MDRRELRSELAFYVNFTEGTADQDFATTRLNKALQAAYKKIVVRAKLMTNKNNWLMNQNVTWPTGALRLILPEGLQQKYILDIFDVSSDEQGERLTIGTGGDAFWFDRKTLQWGAGDSGPGSEMTLRFYYEATPEEWLRDEDSPLLIPTELHMLLVWEAACDLRNIGDDQIPADWKEERKEMRLDYYKWMSRGKPSSTVTTIGKSTPGAGPSTLNVDGFGSIGDGLNPP